LEIILLVWEIQGNHQSQKRLDAKFIANKAHQTSECNIQEQTFDVGHEFGI